MAHPNGDPTSGNLGRAPRTQELQNTRIHSRGGATLVIPDQAVMAAITDETDGKVRHFPTPNTQAFEQSGGRYIGEPAFSTLIMDPLIDELKVRFPGRALALRGVATSINGHMPPGAEGDFDLWDITDSVSRGAEKSDAIFNVAVLNPDEPLSVHRVNQYACNVGMMRDQYMETAEKAEATFPAVLVYDCDGLKKDGHGYYSVSFREGHNPQDVLLAAYVLDCPAG